MAAMVDYAKTRAVFEEYKAAKYSRKYYAEHEADIELHRAARATFQRILSVRSSRKMDVLKQERQRLAAEKRSAYRKCIDIRIAYGLVESRGQSGRSISHPC